MKTPFPIQKVRVAALCKVQQYGVKIKKVEKEK